MKEDNLFEIFSGFTPELPSDNLFIARLKKNMETVEFIRNKTTISKRNKRLAVIIAAVTGFICGIIATLSLPYLTYIVSSIRFGSVFTIRFVSDCDYMIVWSFICITTSLISYFTYDLSSFFLTKSNNIYR